MATGDHIRRACYKLGRSSFYRFLHRYNLVDIGENARRKIIPEIIHVPGEALIVDWGKLIDVLDPTEKKRTLWAFVGVMGFSRYMLVRLVWTNDVPTTLLALEEMIQELGGVSLPIYPVLINWIIEIFWGKW